MLLFRLDREVVNIHVADTCSELGKLAEKRTLAGYNRPRSLLHCVESVDGT